MTIEASKQKTISVDKIDTLIDKLYDRIAFSSRVSKNLDNDSRMSIAEKVKLAEQFSSELYTTYFCIEELKALKSL